MTHRTIRIAAWLAMALGTGLAGFAQTATWSGGGGDGLWNTAANWDLGVPAEGTNAVITAGSVVTYNAPMAATSFAGLNNSGSLDVSAAGFNIDAATLAAYTGNAASLLGVNAGGVVVATNSGDITLLTGSEIAVEGGVLIVTNSTGNILFGQNANNAGAGFTNNGGTVVFSQPFQSRGRFTRFEMRGGTLDLLGGGGIFEGSNDQERRFLIDGGTANLGDFSISRTQNGVSQAGLVLSNGLVHVTSLRVGVANAAAGTTIAGGVLTNTGAFIICDRTNGATAGNRRIHFYIRGGSVYSTDAAGIIVANQANNAAAAASIMGGNLDINSGLLVAEGITLLKDSTLTNAHATLTLAGTGEIYLGSVGLIGNTAGPGTTYTMTFNGGTLGAKEDFSIVGNGTLSGIFTVKAADLAEAPRNITHTGVWGGSGVLTKTGGGVLRLTGNNTYSGATFVNAGTLALDGSGSASNSPGITIASGAALDVSTVSGGYVLNPGRTLAGFGAVTGGVFVAAGGTLNPGTNTAAGTLTFADSLTQSGGAFNHFDLSSNPSGPDNDLLVVGGALNVSGVNTLEIVGGGAPGSAYSLIQYGSFNGTLGNFALNGTSGSLSNDVAGKTIYLVIASAIRGPTNIVWVGSSTDNVWDTVNQVNWSNAGNGDYFVPGDNVRFDATGAAHASVSLVGNNAPASVVVDAAANYAFGGSGAISGSGGLAKTNTGTLTITATNTYSGPTILGGGVLEATTLANGGSASALGAAPADPANLVFDGGTLRYLGGSVAIDRPATLNAGGGGFDVASNETALAIGGAIGGTGALTKTGPGQLILNMGNTYSGGTVVSAGTLQVDAAGSLGGAGLTNHGATLRINGGFAVDNLMHLSGTSTLDLANAAGNTAVRGAWIGDGTVNVINLQNATRTFTIGGNGAGGGHMFDFAGTVDFGTNDGFFRINNDNGNFNFGSSNAVFNVGTGLGTLNQRNGGTTTYLGALLGGPGTKLSGRGGTGAAGVTIYEIGARNLTTTFEGEINNGSGTTAINKVGTGMFMLTGTSTYSGNTAIYEGTLQVDGALTATAMLSVYGGVLAGRGSITSAVEIQSSGTLSVGEGIPGQMTINGTLTFASGSTNLVEINKSDHVIDNVIGLTSVSYGGTLVISMVQGTLADGDSFKLFDAAPGGYLGAFEAIIPETPGSGLRWDTSSLTVDGTLKVTVPGARISSFTFDGSNLNASGSGGTAFAEYQVLTSTNVGAPLSAWETNSTAQFDATGNFSFSTPVDSAAPRRFYILQYQSP